MGDPNASVTLEEYSDYLCPFLCPTLFPDEIFFSFPVLASLFEIQILVQEKAQAYAGLLITDRWNLTTSLLIAPIYEELVFRGPMFLSRGFLRGYLWWSIGIILTIIFVLSHGRTGLALFPLFVMGICCLWLIAKTHHFWPAIALHFLHNFFFSSSLVYQSFLISD